MISPCKLGQERALRRAPRQIWAKGGHRHDQTLPSNQPIAPVNGGFMKFTRNRYQQGSLRRIPRSKGPDVWEFQFSPSETGARKQRQLTLSTKKYPSEAAVKRKAKALLLKLNAGNAAAAVREPTLGAVIQVYIREEMPERPKSQQNYRFADGPALRRHLRPWPQSRRSKAGMAHFPSHVPQLARCGRDGGRSPAEDDASR